MLTYQEKNGIDERIKEKKGPDLYLSIRNLLMEEVTRDVESDSPSVRDLASRFRRELNILTMKKRDSFQCVAGADAGSQILPLASRRYAIISALVYSVPSGARFFLEPESLSIPNTAGGEKFNGVVNVRREAKLYETACKYVEMDSEVELLLVDGPLAFSNRWSMAGRERDRQRLIRAINKLLDICTEENVAVAGVVKRPSARYLIYEMGLQDETELSDSFLLLHALGPGERTDIFSPKSAIRKAVRSSPFMDAIGCPIYSFYSRMSSEWSIPPVRIDLPTLSLGHLDDVADYCYGSSFWGGIPLPIVRADEDVRISRRLVGEIYGDFVSRAGRNDWEVFHLAPIWGEGRWMMA